MSIESNSNTDLKPSSALGRVLNRSKTIRWWLRECTAAIVWSFLLTKLFVFDIDRYCISLLLPSAVWVVDYRLFALMGILALSWLILGNRRFRTVVLYVVFYPFVIILFRGGRLLFYQWPLLIAFLPAAHSLLKRIKFWFVVATTAIISSLFILLSTNHLILEVCMWLVGSFLAVYIISHF